MDTDSDESLPFFENLARDLTDKGYSIQTNALPADLAEMLWAQLQETPRAAFRKAGIGRNSGFSVNALVRKDEIAWIDGASEAESYWMAWTATMQAFLNTRLFLGLFSFESHFARYTKGDFYLRHHDAFSGDGNRILSIILYLNKNWVSTDGGELVLFTGEAPGIPVNVPPVFGTMVAFLSEDFPHEVLTANCDRLSIAGWFRASGSQTNNIEIH